MRLDDLCCRKLALWLPLVDSLEGVPEHLGRKIFQYAMRSTVYSLEEFNAQTRHIFILFNRSYGKLFLDILHVDGHRHKVDLSGWLHLVSLTDSLSRLLLDDCSIGVKYTSLLPYLGRIVSLRQLSLRVNHLCNDHIRSLTAAGRFNRGKSFLRCLDLSGMDWTFSTWSICYQGNGYLNEACLPILFQLSSLVELHCNDTGIAVSYTVVL